MDIFWYGLSCFRLRTRGLSLVTDPYAPSVGLDLPRLRADVVTISHDVPGHNYINGVRGHQNVFQGPGEYEVKGVFITGVGTHHKGKPGERMANTSFVFEFGDITVCHLGDLGGMPGREQEEVLSTADVLILPVGGGDTLDAARAVEIVTELEPAVVIPMHYDMPGLKLDLHSVDLFLKEMGVPRPDPLDSYRVTRSELTGEETKVILLHPQGVDSD
ncbi:MAG: MBL fold metallo-hydrolase [Caldilineales bacterium]|nr:MBL fold metallo-hydrolase [Caldilineales bacterium]